MKSWVTENAPKIKIPDHFNSPLLNLKNPFVDLLSIVADSQIREYIKNRDIGGFLETLHYYGRKNATKFMRIASNQNIQTDPVKNAKELTKLFFKERVDKCKFNDFEIELVGIEGNLLFECLDAYVEVALDSPSFQYSQIILGGAFNKRIAVALAANIINLRDWVNIHKIYLYEILNRTFGSESADLTIKDKLVIFSDAFNKATKPLKEAFLFLVKKGIADIKDKYSVVDTWFNSIKILDSGPGFGMAIPDLSNSTQKDLSEVDNRIRAEMTAKGLTISTLIPNFLGFVRVNEGSSKEVDLWIDKTFEIIYRLLEDGYIKDRSILFEMMSNANIGKKVLPIIEKSIKFYDDIINASATYQVSPYFMASNSRTEESIINLLKWITELQNKGKLSLETNAFYVLSLAAAKRGHVLPFLKLDKFSVIFELLDIEDESYIDHNYFVNYMRWLISNNKEIRDYFINMHETEDFMRFPHTINFIDEKLISDKIIQHYIDSIWPNSSPLSVGELVKDYQSKKMQQALIDYARSFKNKDDPTSKLSYTYYRSAILPIISPKEFNEEIKELINSGEDVQNEIYKGCSFDPAQLLRLVTDITEREDLVDELDTDVFIQLIQLGTKSKERTGGRLRKTLAEFARKAQINDETKIDALLPVLSVDMRTSIVDYLVGAELASAASKEIFRDDVIIKPFEQLTEKRIVDVLKYNNITPDKSLIKNIKTSNDINKIVINFSKKMSDIKATEVKETPEYFERKTIEYDTFNKSKHGHIGPKIVREFNVNLSAQAEAFNKYVTENSWVEIMDPVFHGTGSVAASMILRYGFAVISSNDAAVVGRLLGDGIYFSTVIDKVSQYVTDSGFTRGLGTKGYIFRMKAALGQPNKDYRKADTSSGLVSPEWAVYHPERQLLIYKALEVEIVTKDEIEALKKKHKINENTAVEIQTFKEFLRESQSNEYTQATTYSFVDGNIPIDKNTFVPFEEFKPETFGQHVRIEGSQLGPMVTIEHNGPVSQAFCVRYTDEFMEQPELYEFLELLNVVTEHNK